MLLGLSILIASVSFICYRHPPSSWFFVPWLTRPSIQDIAAKKKDDAPTPLHSHDDLSPPSKESSLPLKQEKNPIATTKESPPQNKQALDRIAMPPPPLFKKPISKAPSLPPTTPLSPESEKTPTIPTFALANPHNDSHSSDEEDDLPPPSFPALNSAQRAGGAASRGPPRLNPLPTSTPSLSLGRPNLMAPPPRPLPNRAPPSSSSSNLGVRGLAPPPTHTSIPPKPRKKVLLTPGHSPLDWARLSSSPSANLRNLPPSTPYLKVPPSLLSKYNGRPSKPPTFDLDGNRVRNDAWTVLGGKVYNITPYLPFHPGGEPELLRVAGKDGSKLFGEVHPWVNWEGMLEGCLIGVAVGEEEVGRQEGGLEEMD